MKKISIKLTYDEFYTLNNFCFNAAEFLNELYSVILIELGISIENKLRFYFNNKKVLNLKIYQAIALNNSMKILIHNYSNNPYEYACLISLQAQIQNKF